MPITYNVNYGTKHGFSKFFQINSINGEARIPRYSQKTVENCPSVRVDESSDGSANAPYLKQTDMLKFYHYMLPRPMPCNFIKEVKHGLIDLYEFTLDLNVYIHSETSDCLDETSGIHLDDGLMDTSQIAYGKVVIISIFIFIHFNLS